MVKCFLERVIIIAAVNKVVLSVQQSLPIVCQHTDCRHRPHNDDYHTNGLDVIWLTSWFTHLNIIWTILNDIETEMSSFWRNFHHWLHRKLSKWQLSVTKMSSKWQRASEGVQNVFKKCTKCVFNWVHFHVTLPVQIAKILWPTSIRHPPHIFV